MEEVIFSGGDPFIVPDRTLSAVLRQLASIGHLRRLRFHTRVPVTFPSRVTLSTWPSSWETVAFPIAVVAHFNHPREVTPQAARACQNLRSAGLSLLNQSVIARRRERRGSPRSPI